MIKYVIQVEIDSGWINERECNSLKEASELYKKYISDDSITYRLIKQTITEEIIETEISVHKKELESQLNTKFKKGSCFELVESIENKQIWFDENKEDYIIKGKLLQSMGLKFISENKNMFCLGLTVKIVDLEVFEVFLPFLKNFIAR